MTGNELTLAEKLFTLTIDVLRGHDDPMAAEILKVALKWNHWELDNAEEYRSRYWRELYKIVHLVIKHIGEKLVLDNGLTETEKDMICFINDECAVGITYVPKELRKEWSDLAEGFRSKEEKK